MTRQLY